MEVAMKKRRLVRYADRQHPLQRDSYVSGFAYGYLHGFFQNAEAARVGELAVVNAMPVALIEKMTGQVIEILATDVEFLSETEQIEVVANHFLDEMERKQP